MGTIQERLRALNKGRSPVRMAVQSFFDGQAVIDAIGKEEAERLKEQGKAVRREARQSIRKRKGASRPGSAPHSHLGQLKKYLFYKYDSTTSSVVIGPEKLGGRGGSVPELLEYGGDGIRNARRIKRPIGDGGIIQIEGFQVGGSRGKVTGEKPQIVLDSKGKFRKVVFAKLLTADMVRRAEHLEEEIYGPMVIPNMKARPYMNPALEKVMPSLASYFRDLF